MSLAILFHFLCAQHVSDIDISIIRSLRLFCWITTLVVLFLFRCVLEFRYGWFGVVLVLQVSACGWVWVVSVLQTAACNTDTTQTQPHRNSNTHRNKNNTTNVVIQQNSRKLLMVDILISETCWAHKKWNKIASDIKLVFYSSTRLHVVFKKLVSQPWPTLPYPSRISPPLFYPCFCYVYEVQWTTVLFFVWYIYEQRDATCVSA